jgi:Zn-dependent peptidase ImmA (M78 family)
MKVLRLLKKEIADSRQLLQNPYAYLDDSGGYSAADRKRQVISGYCNPSDTATHHGGSRNPYAGIERLAREVQVDIWKNRYRLWPDGIPDNPVDLLDPAVAIKHLGFDFDLAEYLGDYFAPGSKTETAGLIDRKSKRIRISRRLPRNTRRFTSAHELGHLLMHKEAVMHRDRPIDGPIQVSEPRSRMEVEADKFASYFLMPANLVNARFSAIFGEEAFALNDATAFALDPINPRGLIAECDTPRALARILAKAERYNGRRVLSLAEQFAVSVEAMAIRLEELELICTND